MGAPYSQDLRERAISVVDGGMGAYEAAPLLRVSVSYIYKALGRRRASGETTARPSGRGPSPKLAPHDDALHRRIAEEPDATLEEIRAWLLARHGVKVSVGCLWKRLRHLGLPLKKSR
jgi:transposase